MICHLTTPDLNIAVTVPLAHHRVPSKPLRIDAALTGVTNHCRQQEQPTLLMPHKSNGDGGKRLNDFLFSLVLKNKPHSIIPSDNNIVEHSCLSPFVMASPTPINVQIELPQPSKISSAGELKSLIMQQSLHSSSGYGLGCCCMRCHGSWPRVRLWFSIARSLQRYKIGTLVHLRILRNRYTTYKLPT